MTWYFIEACDVLMFRDGRPFSAGESHVIQSVFPPTALTIQGALRSLILSQSSAGFSPAGGQETGVGYGDDLGMFAMHGPYLAYRQENGTIAQLLLLPGDIVYTKRGSFVRLSAGKSEDRGLSNFPDKDCIPLEPPAGVQVDDAPDTCYIASDTLNNCLDPRGRVPQADDNNPFGGIIYARALFSEEPRFGIGLDYAQRRPAEGMLYRAAFKRPADNVGLLVWVDPSTAKQLPAEATIPLGGEGRAARLIQCADELVDAYSPEPKTGPNGFKLVLLTPAYFEDGWQPKDGDWMEVFGLPRPSAAVVSRYQMLSGWDLVNQQSRSALRLVPAGSVYYFRSGALPDPALQLTETTTLFPDLKALGFGRVAVGAW